MKKPYIAGNWKMNILPSEAEKYASVIVSSVKKEDVKVMIAPSFVCLPAVANVLKGTNIIVAAQNVNDNDSGAFTGEVSCSMLKDIGVNTVILGHSERRQYYAESDSLINKKILTALKNNMDIVLCIGETLHERESGLFESVISKQLKTCLNGVVSEKFEKITLAYEPVWAIGTGKTATPQDADESHLFIRKFIKELYSDEISRNIQILYGGSVKPSNIKDLMAKENIDGVLVGGASLTAEQFLPIINFY